MPCLISFGSVDLTGERGKRKNTKWKILVHSGTRTHNLGLRWHTLYPTSENWEQAKNSKRKLVHLAGFEPLYQLETLTGRWWAVITSFIESWHINALNALRYITLITARRVLELNLHFVFTRVEYMLSITVNWTLLGHIKFGQSIW